MILEVASVIFILALSVTFCTECSEGSVRLLNSESAERELEFCLGGIWLKVCAYNMDNFGATVVCRELGLSNSETGNHYL
jgi:hypothetical protein